MENEGTFKRRITAGKFSQPQAEELDLRLEKEENSFCDQKEEKKIDQVKLTIEELRSCKGFETVSESEGQDIIESLFRLAVLVYNY